MKELVSQQGFGGGNNPGFRFESNGGTATLYFKKSDDTFVADSDTEVVTSDSLFRLDLFNDQVYHWVLTGSAKIFKEE